MTLQQEIYQLKLAKYFSTFVRRNTLLACGQSKCASQAKVHLFFVGLLYQTPFQLHKI